MGDVYYTATNCSNILQVTVTGNHDSPVATATIVCKDTSLTLGDPVTVNLGYTGNHKQVFSGYVKQIERRSPTSEYTITAYDELIRAQDYFLASADPQNTFKRKGITAESLVADLLSTCGLTNLTYTPTYFTFGINNEFEVNLVGILDYVKTICDLLTWSIWCDSSGLIHFENRKPYVMTGDSGQPGDHADTTLATVLTEYLSLDVQYTVSERSLRNRVVVYGAEGIYASASASSPHLPNGFYKTAVLAMPQIIDSNDTAQQIANYNLNLLNRLTYTISLSVLGDPDLEPRKCVAINIPKLSLSGNWYIYGCDHQLSSEGYITTLDLKRMV